jgi:hypothetical protein
MRDRPEAVPPCFVYISVRPRHLAAQRIVCLFSRPDLTVFKSLAIRFLLKYIIVG